MRQKKKKNNECNQREGKGREESISRRAYFPGVFRMLLRGQVRKVPIEFSSIDVFYDIDEG